MEFKNLENKLKELSEKFKKDLIDALNEKGHHKSGELEDSISFTFRKEGDNYALKFDSLEYIKYLDKGVFWNNFKKEKIKEIKKLISKDWKKEITKDIINELKK